MKIVINASTVALGGGLTEVLNLLYALQHEVPTYKIFYISPDNERYKSINNENFIWIPVPRILLKRVFRPFLDWFWLPKKIKKLSPDWVYTLGNLPSCIKKHKQAFLFNNPFITTNSFRKLNLSFFDILIHKLRKLLFRGRIKFLNLVFTQTVLQQQKFENLYTGDFQVLVLPNATICLPQTDKIKIPLPDKKEGEIRLLVFCHYYPHKNLEILLKVADITKNSGQKIRFILTIEPLQGCRARKLISYIENPVYLDCFLNVGYVPPEVIEDLYYQSDGLLLSTLLESFSSTYIDAMRFGKPVLTSNRDFAREVCGDAAWYFDPRSPLDIYTAIQICFNDHQKRNHKLSIGKKIVNQHPTWLDNTHFILNKFEGKDNANS